MSDENRIVTLSNEITQILGLMVSLESIDDARSYSTLDILEALDLTTIVVAQRVEEGHDDWKDDAKRRFENFFDSVKDQVRLTITNYFVIPNTKSPRFVETFNLLILERLFDMLLELGPQATGSMILPLVNMFKLHLEQIGEVADPLSVSQAQEQLKIFRKQTLAPKALTRDQRLEYIRVFVEKVQEQLT